MPLSCGHRNEKSANYCSSCGNYIADAVEVKTASVPVVGGELDPDLGDSDSEDLESSFAFLTI